MIHNISQDKIRKDAGTECQSMDEVDPCNPNEDIEQLQEYQEDYEAADTNTDDREGTTGGSLRKTPYEECKVKDHILRRHP